MQLNDTRTSPLFIFEMANNHMGDVNHGLALIDSLAKVAQEFQADFQFAIKFQYRDLDTFIHPDYKDRLDLKYIKRFSETRLAQEDFLKMKSHAEASGLLTVCTPFDEISVNRVNDQDYSVFKIASCSFTDWPLLEEIVKFDRPVIASTAGATLEEIDSVVSFFQNRNKQLILMHCVAEYPTLAENMKLNRIDILKERYENIQIGFSTHEDPSDSTIIGLALAKGARVFEKHVGLKTDQYDVNQYSSTPDQVRTWLNQAKSVLRLLGQEEQLSQSSEKERSTLRSLARAVFAKTDISEGEVLNSENTFLAIPGSGDQILANDFSKYTSYTAKHNIPANSVISPENVQTKNNREHLLSIVGQVSHFIKESHVAVPKQVDLEISHHYGLEKFSEVGAVLINCVNRDYCKKIIIMLPGQLHPEQYHEKKEETFHILSGSMLVRLDGVEKKYSQGDVILVKPTMRHEMLSESGVIFEEISSTHYKNDSFYSDTSITQNTNRKTYVTHWL